MWFWIIVAAVVLGFLTFLWAMLGVAKKADRQVNEQYRKSMKERQKVRKNTNSKD